MPKLICLALALVAGTAAAQDSTAAPSAQAALHPAQTAAPELERFGLEGDLGVPSGATVAFVARPWDFLRLDAGIGYNALAFGFKGGVTFAPFHWAVVPTFGLEAGHYFGGDVTRFVSVSDPTLKILLSDAAYDYVSADVGVEFGAQNRFVFYVRAGLAMIYAPVNNFQAAVDASNPPGRVTVGDASASARIPSVRVGFVLYLF